MAKILRRKIVIFWIVVQFLHSAMTMEVKGMYWTGLDYFNKTRSIQLGDYIILC